MQGSSFSILAAGERGMEAKALLRAFLNFGELSSSFAPLGVAGKTVLSFLVIMRALLSCLISID